MKSQQILATSLVAICGLWLNGCQASEPSTWDEMLQCADNARTHKQFDKAEKYFQMAIDDGESKHPDPSTIVIAASHYAGMQAARGKYHDAEQLYKKALDIDEKHLAVDSPEVVQMVKSLAHVLSKEGKEKEAKQLLAKENEARQVLAKEKEKKQLLAHQKIALPDNPNGAKRELSHRSNTGRVSSKTTPHSQPSSGFGMTAIGSALEPAVRRPQTASPASSPFPQPTYPQWDQQQMDDWRDGLPGSGKQQVLKQSLR